VTSAGHSWAMLLSRCCCAGGHRKGGQQMVARTTAIAVSSWRPRSLSRSRGVFVSWAGRFWWVERGDCLAHLSRSSPVMSLCTAGQGCCAASQMPWKRCTMAITASLCVRVHVSGAQPAGVSVLRTHALKLSLPSGNACGTSLPWSTNTRSAGRDELPSACRASDSTVRTPAPRTRTHGHTHTHTHVRM
jgi:hypothetical protein